MFKLFAYLVVWLLASATCIAEIYQWRDKDGNLHFGDRPPREAEIQKVKLKINSYQNVEVMDGQQWADDRSKTGSKRVVMYSTKWCGACKRAKRYFSTNKIPFTEYDVETSAKGKKDFASMNGKGVPIIMVGNRRMNGFSAQRFESIYNTEKKASK